MANSRIVNTNFWKDTYILDLEPDEKLLFIYFLTNPRTTLAGIYEISLREVAFDTNLDKSVIEKCLYKFADAGKIYHIKNWLILTNFIKHQRLNPSIVRGIEKAIDELPTWLQEKIDLKKDDNDQLSIFMAENQSYPQEEENNRGKEQTVTVSPQYKEIKSNIKKLKEKKSKETKADEPRDDSKESSKSQKRSYAIAMDREREQKARANKSFARTGSGLESARATIEKIKEGKKS